MKSSSKVTQATTDRAPGHGRSMDLSRQKNTAIVTTAAWW